MRAWSHQAPTGLGKTAGSREKSHEVPSPRGNTEIQTLLQLSCGHTHHKAPAPWQKVICRCKDGSWGCSMSRSRDCSARAALAQHLPQSVFAAHQSTCWWGLQRKEPPSSLPALGLPRADISQEPAQPQPPAPGERAGESRRGQVPLCDPLRALPRSCLQATRTTSREKPVAQQSPVVRSWVGRTQQPALPLTGDEHKSSAKLT